MGLITWRISSRTEISARLLKQILLKSNWRLQGEGFGPVRNSAGPKIPARYLHAGPGFSARPNGLKNPCNHYHFFYPGPKKEREYAHRLCFRTSVNFVMEISVLRPGWNWACNQALHERWTMVTWQRTKELLRRFWELQVGVPTKKYNTAKEAVLASLKNAVYESSLRSVDLPLTHLQNFLAYILRSANFFHKITSAGDIFSSTQGTT